MKMIFNIFNRSKKDLPQQQAATKISREELRDFLINNDLKGDLLKKVTDLKAKYSDLTNYQAVEFLMDRLEN